MRRFIFFMLPNFIGKKMRGRKFGIEIVYRRVPKLVNVSANSA